jgi:hypothetical protein
MQLFSATVRKIDINPYVKVPDRIVQKLQQAAKRENGPIPVKGTLQGQPFLATVVRFRAMWRLYLNTAMRRATSVQVGDKVTLGLRFDRTPRAVPIPRRLMLALSRDKRAQETFQSLAPSRQREILRYLNSLKRPETLERNVDKVVRLLHGEKVQSRVPVTQTK